ncbi:MAG TPA: sulfite exporter TauE/SafE family protein [Steroidobacteraceae bacterium]|jgi:uncharacterized membrane protein YfcA
MLGKVVLLSALALINIAFVTAWIRARANVGKVAAPGFYDILIGFVTDFFDTLGIGSFAPTTAIYKLRGTPPDELIPGTLNVGHNAAAITSTVIFVTSVVVEPWLLVCTVGSAALGAWLGAGIVSRLRRERVQLVMGVALLVAAMVFTLTNLGALPGGGMAQGLYGASFAIAVAANFVFGALMSAGIGLYAPCMITLALLGLSPLAAFPIMMGSCGLVQPSSGLRFIATNRFAWTPALGLTLGGVPGVLLAAFVVRHLRMDILRWLVTLVVLYAAFMMFRGYFETMRTRQPSEA